MVNGAKLRKRLTAISLNTLTAVLAVGWASIIVWAVVVSFRPSSEPLGRGDVWFGHTLTFANYLKAWSLAPFGIYYRNTIVIVGMILIAQLITITLAGFAFAHQEFWGKKAIFFFILLQLMIPAAALLVPNFSTIRKLGLFDTTLAVALPYFGSAFGTFLMRQAFLEVPRDLVDAGIMDGCSWWQLLWHIYLPPSVPTLVAFALSSVSWHWNEFLWPLVVTLSNRSRPLTIGLVRFTQLGEIGARWPLLAAATITVIAPLFLLFLIFQKQFIRSFLHSGLK
jgi:sn-glycerol 3-phosphate transport system permease protein